jgi:uroporphyrinogen decarboxylase
MTTPLANDRFLRALLREPVDRTPIWIMRQAGRYLPEYRASRARAGSFLDLCQNPELACEVTMQPLARFPLDAAILFSDILTVPDAMGLGLYFETGEGPRFRDPVRSLADIERLPIPDPEQELRYVMDAVRLIRRELQGRVPLIGFAGSPWTLATYMVEGATSRDFAETKRLLYGEPQAMHALLQKVSAAVASYLNAQIQAGAQAVMIFDTWGGSLSPRHYREFSLAYMQRIVDELTREHEGRRVPVILFTKGADPGSSGRRIPAPMRWASTGPSRSPRPRPGSGTGSRCRETWIHRCCMPETTWCGRRHGACWTASRARPGTYSTWVTASIPASIRTGWPRSSRRCTPTAAVNPEPVPRLSLGCLIRRGLCGLVDGGFGLPEQFAHAGQVQAAHRAAVDG